MYAHVHVHACSSSKVAGGRVGSYDTHTCGTGNDLMRVCKTKSTKIICYAINCITYVYVVLTGSSDQYGKNNGRMDLSIYSIGWNSGSIQLKNTVYMYIVAKHDHMKNKLDGVWMHV
jgi:hypothetical protein